MIKVHITGKVTHDIDVVIEAESVQDAKEILDMGDGCLEFCDEAIRVVGCCQYEVDIESEKVPAADKWESLSVLERAIVLKENGVSDEAALDVAERDYLFDIDEEWWGYFDEE